LVGEILPAKTGPVELQRPQGPARSRRFRRSAAIIVAGIAGACTAGASVTAAPLSLLFGGAGIVLLLGFVAAILRQDAALARQAERLAELDRVHLRLAGLVDNLPGVVFQRIVNAEGEISYSYFNKRIEDFVGISAAAAVAEPGLLFSRLDRAAVEDWAEALTAQTEGDPAEAGQDFAREMEIVIPGQPPRWVMLVTRARPDGAGCTIWDGIASDISELKEWQQQLVTVKEQAILANRSKSQFLAVMSHELRTPLNAVIGFAEVLQAEFFGPLTPKQRGYLGDILQSGQHLLDIINSILDLAKIEAGKSELYEDACAIAEVIAYQIQLIQPRAMQAGLSIRFETTPDLPLLYVDQTKLKQMLLNLLSNAIKFTPTGGRITVRLALEPAPDGPPLMALAIADTGVGIAPEDVPKAFASFQQIDNRLARKHEGAGLGLPLVKAQIEQHGGSIEIDSKLDVGTTVTLRFPAWRLFRSIDELPVMPRPE
jgi:signal transduction histidine kinase